MVILFALLLAAASGHGGPAIRVRHAVPPFSGPCVNPDHSFGTVSLESLTKDGSWGLLVFFPAAWVRALPPLLLLVRPPHTPSRPLCVRRSCWPSTMLTPSLRGGA
jgi:hypothetical protein